MDKCWILKNTTGCNGGRCETCGVTFAIEDLVCLKLVELKAKSVGKPKRCWLLDYAVECVDADNCSACAVGSAVEESIETRIEMR